MAQVDQLNDIQVREMGREIAALLRAPGNGLGFDAACDAIFSKKGIANGHELRPAIGKFLAECRKRNRLRKRQERVAGGTQGNADENIAREFEKYFREVLVHQIIADQDELRESTNEDVCPVD